MNNLDLQISINLTAMALSLNNGFKFLACQLSRDLQSLTY